MVIIKKIYLPLVKRSAVESRTQEAVGESGGLAWMPLYCYNGEGPAALKAGCPGSRRVTRTGENGDRECVAQQGPGREEGCIPGGEQGAGSRSLSTGNRLDSQ